MWVEAYLKQGVLHPGTVLTIFIPRMPFFNPELFVPGIFDFITEINRSAPKHFIHFQKTFFSLLRLTGFFCFLNQNSLFMFLFLTVSIISIYHKNYLIEKYNLKNYR